MKYFAYGSNMDKLQMGKRCSNYTFLGKALLNGFILDFTRESSHWNGGVADIVNDPNHTVWGILYELNNKDLDSLDYYEACPQYYKRKKVNVVFNSIAINAIAYEVVNKKTFIPPSKKYLSIIIQAAIENDFPEEYIDYLKSIKTK